MGSRSQRGLRLLAAAGARLRPSPNWTYWGAAPAVGTQALGPVGCRGAVGGPGRRAGPVGRQRGVCRVEVESGRLQAWKGTRLSTRRPPALGPQAELAIPARPDPVPRLCRGLLSKPATCSPGSVSSECGASWARRLELPGGCRRRGPPPPTPPLCPQPSRHPGCGEGSAGGHQAETAPSSPAGSGPCPGPGFPSALLSQASDPLRPPCHREAAGQRGHPHGRPWRSPLRCRGGLFPPGAFSAPERTGQCAGTGKGVSPLPQGGPPPSGSAGLERRDIAAQSDSRCQA